MQQLLFLGVGAVARSVRSALPALPAFGTTRREPDARFNSMIALSASNGVAIADRSRDAGVVVSFPPDGHSDRRLADHITRAASLVYLSSTAVYPPNAGLVDEESAVATSGERALLRLQAEAVWRERGASVVRLPAFYGPESGLHLSLARGTFRMPGAGTNVVSRVHVEDAARFVVAALGAPRGSLLLAGDDEPAPLIDVISFVCELFGLVMPESSHGEDVPVSLRGSRRVENSRTKARYDIGLAYPSYRQGYRSIRAAARHCTP